MSRTLRQGEWAIWGALASDRLVAEKALGVEISIDAGLEDAVHRLERTHSPISSSSYALLIRHCTDSGDLDRGRRVHAHIRRSRRDDDTFLGNLVVEMYGKLGCLEDARAAFDRIAVPNGFSANMMAAAFARCHNLEEAKAFLGRNSSLVNAVAWNTILSAYAQLGDICQVKHCFTTVIVRNVVSWNILVCALCNDGKVDDAMDMMVKMPYHSVVTWNAVIGAYASEGQHLFVKEFFVWMAERDVLSWFETLGCLSEQGEITEAKMIFDAMPQKNAHASIAMIQGFAQCGDVEMARNLFDDVPEKNLVLWNAMIWGYSINRLVCDAKSMFDALPATDAISWNTLISALARSHLMREATQVFESMHERDMVSWNTLLQGFGDGESASFDSARSLFEKMPERSLLVWNLVLKASMLQGQVRYAETIFHEMPGRNFSSWNALHGGYVENEALPLGQDVMDRMPALDRVVCTLMVVGYARDGHLAKAETMIQEMPDRDVVAWNSLLQAFVEQGSRAEEVKRIFDGMPERNIVSWSVLIGAFVRRSRHRRELPSLIEMAKSVFERMSCWDIVSSNAMVVFFADNGLIEDARKVVESMDRKNAASWIPLLEGYVKAGCNKEALELYRSMDLDASSNPESYSNKSFVWILEACARSVCLSAGQSIHHDLSQFFAARGGRTHLAPSLATALLDMYGRCGELDEARKIFNTLSCRSVSCWNSMIAAYAHSGHGKQALELFLLMGLDGFNPNRMTLVIVLSACSHSGLVSVAIDLFLASGHVLGKDHFSCMIDLLGRAGRIEEARDFISAMPVEPDRVAWTAILGACKVHGDGSGGAVATERVIQLDPSSSSPYVAAATMTYNINYSV